MTEILVTALFVMGYVAIITESKLKINKAASALIAGTLCWTTYILFQEDKNLVVDNLMGQMGSISGILFFLLSAMTIVELIDSHNGFDIITERITTRNKRKLLWIICIITFFLSALLDNLTTTIVMVSLTRKLIHQERDRWFFAGMIVIAANAGGAWSPMGDVTTTMLWIGGQISASQIVTRLFLPSLVCMMVPLLAATFMIAKGKSHSESAAVPKTGQVSRLAKRLIFFAGMLGLLLVPVFKTLTGLPPFMGMLGALGCMWLLTEIIHRGDHDQSKNPLSVNKALQRLDTPTILFFLGILLCISSLEVSGALESLSGYLNRQISNQSVIILLIGLFSAVIDNVPLVAAVQGMYPLTQYPMDHFLWEFLAYTTGTGGSILIIGSAAGVAAMGMEKITFMWFFKRISLLAMIGYFAGAAVYIFAMA
jgi:Na+/H+ antiporter NhaD/arsenite permease-like protein